MSAPATAATAAPQGSVAERVGELVASVAAIQLAAAAAAADFEATRRATDAILRQLAAKQLAAFVNTPVFRRNPLAVSSKWVPRRRRPRIWGKS